MDTIAFPAPCSKENIMSVSQEVMQLARSTFVLALRQYFDCRVPPLGIVGEIITDREGESIRLSWVTQSFPRYVIHAEGQFYPSSTGGRLDIFPRLRVPDRSDLELNTQSRSCIVTLCPDGSIQLAPVDELVSV